MALDRSRMGNKHSFYGKEEGWAPYSPTLGSGATLIVYTTLIAKPV